LVNSSAPTVNQRLLLQLL